DFVAGCRTPCSTRQRSSLPSISCGDFADRLAASPPCNSVEISRQRRIPEIPHAGGDRVAPTPHRPRHRSTLPLPAYAGSSLAETPAPTVQRRRIRLLARYRPGLGGEDPVTAPPPFR